MMGSAFRQAECVLVPSRPPIAAKADKLLGSKSLPSWPGEKANLLSLTSNSCLEPGLGLRASVGVLPRLRVAP
jgi:hypothetical protein